MAVFYKWIKGCNAGASTDSGQWTYLKWSNGYDDTHGSSERLPTLHACNGKQDTLTGNNVYNLGYILTNSAKGIMIEEDWCFNYDTMLFFGKQGSYEVEPYSRKIGVNCFATGNSDDGNKFYLYTNNWTIKDSMGYDNPNKPTKYDTIMQIYGKDRTKSDSESHVDFTSLVNMQNLNVSTDTKLNELEVTGTTTLNDKLTINCENEKSIETTGGIYSDKQCEALYFNARSDKRAKENITPATYNALDLIKNLPIYNFNYKSKPEEKVTGILAQDLLEVQPEGLDLVSNVNATGEDGDYMSIKNDKLMFVLMKAIQEQQEQIEKLQTELKQLKQA